MSRARAIVEAGIGVVGHIGLTPQSATLLGGFKTQGKTAAAARALIRRGAGRSRPQAASRSSSRPCRRRWPRRITATARDPDDRDRRGGRLRRPGARLPRPARAPRKAGPAALRKALRQPFPRDSRPRSRPTRRRCESGAFPGPEQTPTRCRRRSSRRSRQRPSGRPHEAALRARCPTEVAHRRYNAFGSTANAATITPAIPSAPTTPRHGRRNVVRSPSATQPATRRRTRARSPRRRPARCLRLHHPSGTKSEPPSPSTDRRDAGRRARARTGSAAKPSTWRAMRNGASTPTRLGAEARARSPRA